MGTLLLWIFLIVKTRKFFIRLTEGKLSGFVFAFLGGAFIVIICALILDSIEPEYKKVSNVEEVPIYSLSTIHSCEGNFYLGTGSIVGNSYYYYNIRKGKGFVLDKVFSKNAMIIEDNSIKPCIRTIYYERGNLFFRFMLGKGKERGINEIYIPTGSIINSYYPNI